MTKKASGGFTLIEMMIVVAIVAILGAIALPNYTAHVQRARMADAFSQLAEVRTRLEQYYQDNRDYGTTAGTCPGTLPTSDYFTFSCNWGSGGSNQGFLVTATGSGAMNGFTFTVSHTNVRQTTAFVHATGLPKNCWIQRAGDSC